VVSHNHGFAGFERLDAIRERRAIGLFSVSFFTRRRFFRFPSIVVVSPHILIFQKISKISVSPK